MPRRGFAEADDPSAVLTWRLRERLKDAAEAQQDNRPRPLAALTLTQLHTLNRLAASHRATAREALKAADAAFTHLPADVTTRAGHTHPAWDQRPMGELTRRELAAQLALVRTQIRRSQTNRNPLFDTARHVIGDLNRESQLRRALNWRDVAREDFQRERATSSAAPGATSPAAIRRNLPTRRATTAQRRHFARAALARADAVCDKIYAELWWRERLPDHAPHRPNYRGDIPDWVADRHALVHPDTPEHWVTHLAERHCILVRSLADRGHTLAGCPPAWARPLGSPPPASATRQRPPAAATPGPPPAGPAQVEQRCGLVAPVLFRTSLRKRLHGRTADLAPDRFELRAYGFRLRGPVRPEQDESEVVQCEGFAQPVVTPAFVDDMLHGRLDRERVLCHGPTVALAGSL
ncbi:hypothetical protein [Streptomyces sp. NPDC057889]|uniref:hypothetical protein n=1 Tax=unclassified Streptomyces TaxID=2593676 RepID=UPI00367CF8D9